MSVVVEQATIANAELLDAFNRLIPQLSTSNKPPTQEQLAEIKVQMESLKIQDMTKDLATDLAGMTAALGGIVGVGVDDDDASATPGLEDIMANSKVSVNEDEFSAIMSK